MTAMFLRVPAIVLVVYTLTVFAGCFGGDAATKDGTPSAIITVTPRPDGITFLFDATNSTDPDGSAEDLQVEWNFGDGGEQIGPLLDYGLIEYTYAVTNVQFYVSLVVRDTDGNANSTIEAVFLGTGVNVAPEVHFKNTTRWIKPGGGIVMDVSKSDDHDQDLFSYEWILGNFSATPSPETTFDTGYLPMGGLFNQTFNEVGVYDIHCHPHPWMKGRIIVAEDSQNGTTPTVLSIRNFAYSTKVVNVAPGSTIQFLNEDPVEHTATMEMFSPGKPMAQSPILSPKLDNGSYQARIILDDGKGGRSSRTFGLKASEDAPENPLVKTYPVTITNTAAQPYQGEDQPAEGMKIDWSGNLTATISWGGQDPSGSNPLGVHYRIQLILLDQVVQGACIEEGASCTLTSDVNPGTYRFRILPEGNSVMDTATITVTVQQYTEPGFGDSVSSGHHHQH